MTHDLNNPPAAPVHWTVCWRHGCNGLRTRVVIAQTAFAAHKLAHGAPEFSRCWVVRL